MRADFERLIEEMPGLELVADDGATIRLKDFAERMKDEEAMINAMKVCALG